MWYSLAMNPKSIFSIFGNNIPSLENVLLKKMNFDSNGPVVEIFLDLENYPSAPPIKWLQSGYNTARIWMKLIDIKSIRLDGWESDNVVNVQLREIEDNLIYLSAIGNTCNITMSFRWLDVGVTGYTKDSR
jgi:hypothetical protein